MTRTQAWARRVPWRDLYFSLCLQPYHLCERELAICQRSLPPASPDHAHRARWVALFFFFARSVACLRHVPGAYHTRWVLRSSCSLCFPAVDVDPACRGKPLPKKMRVRQLLERTDRQTTTHACIARTVCISTELEELSFV